MFACTSEDTFLFQKVALFFYNAAHCNLKDDKIKIGCLAKMKVFLLKILPHSVKKTFIFFIGVRLKVFRLAEFIQRLFFF